MALAETPHLLADGLKRKNLVSKQNSHSKKKLLTTLPASLLCRLARAAAPVLPRSAESKNCWVTWIETRTEKVV